jgi:hypothetical protein
MSGGYFDYEQYKIDRIADEVEQLIISNDYNALNEWGDPIGRGYSAETIHEFKLGLQLLKIAAVYAQRIDWLVSGDDGEDSFHQRLLSDLKKLEET